jgi:hypothetical protein
MPGYANPVPGFGFRHGFGGGYRRGFGQGAGRGIRRGSSWRGFGVSPWGASPPYSQSGYYPADMDEALPDEMDILKSQEKYLENALRDLRRRIEVLESGKDSSNQT